MIDNRAILKLTSLLDRHVSGAIKYEQTILPPQPCSAAS